MNIVDRKHKTEVAIMTSTNKTQPRSLRTDRDRVNIYKYNYTVEREELASGLLGTPSGGG